MTAHAALWFVTKESWSCHVARAQRVRNSMSQLRTCSSLWIRLIGSMAEVDAGENVECPPHLARDIAVVQIDHRLAGPAVNFLTRLATGKDGVSETGLDVRVAWRSRRFDGHPTSVSPARSDGRSRDDHPRLPLVAQVVHHVAGSLRLARGLTAAMASYAAAEGTRCPATAAHTTL